MMLRDEIELISPESLVLQLEVGGVGSRFLAIFVDSILQGVLYVLIFLAGFGTLELTARTLEAKAYSLAGAIVILLVFVVHWGYFVLFETLWNGQSPGKRAFGLRVAKMGGEPLTFFDSAIRNLLRFVDFLPLGYGVGISVALCNRYYRRVGDYAAGTVVLRVRSPEFVPRVLDSKPSSPTVADKSVPAGPSPVAEGLITRVELSLVTLQDYEIIRNFLLRRNELDLDSRSRLADKIAAALKGKMSIAPTDARWQTSEAFLELLGKVASTASLRSS